MAPPLQTRTRVTLKYNGVKKKKKFQRDLAETTLPGFIFPGHHSMKMKLPIINIKKGVLEVSLVFTFIIFSFHIYIVG